MLGPKIQHFSQRKLALIYDDSGSRQQAVLVAAAHQISDQTVNEMLTLGAGLLCAALSPGRAATLELQRMGQQRQVPQSSSHENSDFCVSVEAREGVSTGISVSDRATTLRILGEESPTPRKLVSPGHIFPVITRGGGVLEKSSLREAALDLVRIASMQDAAAFSDVLDEQGRLQDDRQVLALGEQHNIPVLKLSEIIRHRLEHEQLVERLASTKLPTLLGGEMRSFIYRSSLHDGEHLALVKGEIDPHRPVLTRVQPEFTFGDVFGGHTPPTRHVIQRSLSAIAAHGSGVLVYLRRPQGGELQAQVQDWQSRFKRKPAALMREYGVGSQILRDLGVRKIELLTNSQNKLVGVTTFGVEIVATRPIP